MQSHPHWLHSALLDEHGFTHGFGTRHGNLNELRQPLFQLQQVHGNKVKVLDAEDTPEVISNQQADALATCIPGHQVAVRTADCIPLLLAHPDSGAVAAVHAGWRGVESNIAAHAVQTLCAATGCDSAALIAAIGPHIRRHAFELSDEIAQRLVDCANDDAVRTMINAKPHIDLARIMQHQLQRAGLKASRIDTLPHCTFTMPELFFSYRRDSGHAGRQYSAITARQA